MSDISIPRSYDTATAPQRQAQIATSDTGRSSQTTAQSQHPATGALRSDPTDIIATSPAASAFLGALNSQLSLGNTESQKDFDAKQLKDAIQQLHILQLLGIGLSPEQLAKETTDLAKRIAGIAKDYADNSGGTLAGAVSPPSTTASATSEADAAATQATSGASTVISAEGSTATGADQAARAARTSAEATARSARSGATNTQSALTTAGPSAPSSTGAAPAPSTASSTSPTAASEDPNQATADNANLFFGEVAEAFKDLKKLESRALSLLNLSPDKEKKKEAKKLGGEFNDAVQSATQSAAAAGASGAVSELSDQTIDLSKVTLNISA